MLSTNQIALFSVTRNAETLGLTRETGVRGEKRPSRIREGPRKFAKRGDENLYGDRDCRNQGSRAHLETGGGE